MHETTSISFELYSISLLQNALVQPQPIAAVPRKGMLVVEDDPSTRRAVSRFFQRLGWDVYPAATVAEGMALLGHRVDAAILDLNLPDGDGASVLQAIRELGLPIKVVVASATADGDHLARVARMAPDLLLQKPIDYDSLLQAFEVGTQSAFSQYESDAKISS